MYSKLYLAFVMLAASACSNSDSSGDYSSAGGSPGSGGAAGSGPGGNTVTVTVGEGGFNFSPADVTIAAGTTVHWVFAASGHTVTSGTNCTPDGAFCSPGDANCESSQLSQPGSAYDHTFTTPGTFAYFCVPHCTMGMTGTVTVTP